MGDKTLKSQGMHNHGDGQQENEESEDAQT